MRLHIGCGSEERGAIAFFLMSFLGMPLSHELACLFVACERNQSRKKAFPKSSLPTAALPKSALPFSLLLPAVKLLMETPSCTAASAHPSTTQVTAFRPKVMACTALIIMGRWLPAMFSAGVKNDRFDSMKREILKPSLQEPKV